MHKWADGTREGNWAIRATGVCLYTYIEAQNSWITCTRYHLIISLAIYHALLQLEVQLNFSLQHDNSTNQQSVSYAAVTNPDCSKSSWQEHTFSIQHCHATSPSITILTDCFKQTCIMRWNKGSLRLDMFCTWQHGKSHATSDLTFHLLEYFTSKEINRKRWNFCEKPFRLVGKMINYQHQ